MLSCLVLSYLIGVGARGVKNLKILLWHNMWTSPSIKVLIILPNGWIPKGNYIVDPLDQFYITKLIILQISLIPLG